ncbi:MAG: PadR family transcriptional regulator [Propionibacteriaceae bacterium]|jgi:DNA-binding PadR family transcriptional regulator|nr:PadR family transcriptional regulator [Propionibacteriaceae bacterium]
MSAIDLIVLGILKQQPRSAYEIHKVVEYRSIAQWVKISTPSIYKKVLQLEAKGYIQSTVVKQGKMPEKAVYSLTKAGLEQFHQLIQQISSQPVRLLLDFNAVIVNLDAVSIAEREQALSNIADQVRLLEDTLEQSLRVKQAVAEVPETGLAVLRQQLELARVIRAWIADVS